MRPERVVYPAPVSGETGHATDRALAASLLAGDEEAFDRFARTHHPMLVRVAAARLGRSSPILEEVAQEAWLVFFEKLPSYEGRSTLRTFLVGVLVNVLRNRARAEARSVPLSSLVSDGDDEGASVAAERFLPVDDPWGGHWVAAPLPWQLDVADRARVRAAIEAALETLPAAQREVITLRDVLGWDGEEICNALGISDTHQRVLLHRARTKVRSALESRFAEVR